MRWRNLVRRFASMFADGVAAGDDGLAERLAAVAMGLAEAEEQLGELPVAAFLDHLELGELANCETKPHVALDSEALAQLAEAFEGLLDDARDQGWECAEAAPSYAEVA